MRQSLKTRVVVTLLSFAAPAGVALGAAVGPAGCSRHDADDANNDASTEEPEWVPPHRHDAGWDGGIGDGGLGYDASDGRAEHELDLLLDAGHFCGSRDLHDCPLQGWMKINATTMLEFGDISTLAVVFDQIVALAPMDTNDDGGLLYENWKSIAHDGANASRAGNISAVRAACRGCHSEYRARYHANLRARGLPPIPAPPPFPAPPASP